MFEVYSTQGLVAHELEAFGITGRPFDSQKKNNRKSRVSTEIHPDLLFAEFLLEERENDDSDNRRANGK